MPPMDPRSFLAGVALLSLAACGGTAQAPTSPSPSAPPPAASKPASALASSPAPASKPVTAASGSASAKPAAAGSAAAKPAAGAPASGLIKVNGSFTTISPTAAPLWVAKERGLFTKNGLDVTLTSTVANATLPALMANELQFASTSPSEVANVDVQGGSVVMVAEGTTYPIFSLFANKKYPTIHDLDGQTIGVTAVGAASDTAAHLFFKKLDMEGKIKTTGAGGSSTAVLAAMVSGGLAGGIVQPPVTISAADQGFVELVNGLKLGVPISQGSIAITRAYLKDHQEEAKRFLRSYYAGWTYVADPANRADVIKLFEQYTKTDSRLSTGTYEYMLPLWQGSKVPAVHVEAIANAISFAPDPKVKSADPNQFFDNSLLEAVAKE
jgi:NitT/TauT family transport system substrate-binding protein